MAIQETKDVGTTNGISVEENDYLADTVQSKHPLYIKWRDDSELPRSLMGGTRAMIEQGETFLPKFPLEKPEFYKTRLANSILLNAYKKTVQFLSGQVFQAPIKLTAEFPSEVEQYMDDVDKIGSSLDVFSKRVFENGLAEGVSHILIEAPITEPGATKLEEKENGIRPYMKEINPLTVIGWRTDINGFLTQIKIVEIVTEPVGDFGEKAFEQVKVLAPGSWATYRRVEGSDDYKKHEEGNTSLDYIPLVTFIPGQPTSILTGETPLMDLADLNLKHWRSSSDQTNILHVARVPILFGRFIDISQFNIASSKAIIADNEDADLRYVEHSGAAIAAGAADLKEIQAEMALYGLQQLIPRTGNQTATEKALSAAESNSSLGMWVSEYQDTVVRALEIFGDYLGVQVPEDSVELPTAFQKGLVDPVTLKLLIDASDRGILSKRAVFDAINRHDLLGDGITWDIIQEDMDTELKAEGPATLTGIFGT